jgi:hypothetical protein
VINPGRGPFPKDETDERKRGNRGRELQILNNTIPENSGVINPSQTRWPFFCAYS